MSLLSRIKKDQLLARKEHDKVTALLLTTLIGEAAMVGKNNGNRDSTDAEVVAVVKKFIKNNNETLRAAVTDTVVNHVKTEIAILERYLPKQLTAAEIEKFFEDSVYIWAHEFCASENDKPEINVGVLMKELKNQHEGQYDGKIASQLAKKVLG